MRAKLIYNAVVATSVNPSDSAIVELRETKGWPHFRGSENDVLDRFFQAGRHYGSDAVVRISSDCPLIDPLLADRVIRVYLDGPERFDYVSNNFPSRTFPLGLDVEVVRFSALKTAWEEDKNPKWREHVTPYLYHIPRDFACMAL
jgi:spore coat polysaccharide biosynthesis protein SpsF